MSCGIAHMMSHDCHVTVKWLQIQPGEA